MTIGNLARLGGYGRPGADAVVGLKGTPALTVVTGDGSTREGALMIDEIVGEGVPADVLRCARSRKSASGQPS